LCAAQDGYSLHAGVFIPPDNRDELEQLLRYMVRPAVATKRLSKLPNGNLKYKLKKPWTDGTTAMVFTPLELIARLASIIAPRYMHLTRYFGVLAPDHHWRSWIVPQHDTSPKRRLRDWQTKNKHKERYYSWHELLKRIFIIDILVCPKCGGKMRILTAINTPEIITKILVKLNKAPNSPPIVRAKSADELEYEYRNMNPLKYMLDVLHGDGNIVTNKTFVEDNCDNWSQDDIDSYCEDLPVIRYE